MAGPHPPRPRPGLGERGWGGEGQSALTLRKRIRALRQAIAQFLYGMTGYEFAHHALHMRAEANTVLMLVTFGDMIGLPVLPPYYSLRLLPYVTPELAAWKRQLLREKHPLDDEEFDLIEM